MTWAIVRGVLLFVLLCFCVRAGFYFYDWYRFSGSGQFGKVAPIGATP